MGDLIVRPLTYRDCVRLRHALVSLGTGLLQAGRITADQWQALREAADQQLREDGQRCLAAHRRSRDSAERIWANAWGR